LNDLFSFEVVEEKEIEQNVTLTKGFTQVDSELPHSHWDEVEQDLTSSNISKMIEIWDSVRKGDTDAQTFRNITKPRPLSIIDIPVPVLLPKQMGDNTLQQKMEKELLEHLEIEKQKIEQWKKEQWNIEKQKIEQWKKRTMGNRKTENRTMEIRTKEYRTKEY